MGLAPPVVDLSRFKKYVDPDACDDFDTGPAEPQGPGLSGLPPPKIKKKFDRYDDDDEIEKEGTGLAALPPPRVSIPRRYDSDEYSEESEDYDYYDDDEFQVGEKRRRKIIVSIYAPVLTACSYIVSCVVFFLYLFVHVPIRCHCLLYSHLYHTHLLFSVWFQAPNLYTRKVYIVFLFAILNAQLKHKFLSFSLLDVTLFYQINFYLLQLYNFIPTIKHFLATWI
jgi:hypothetical protein